MQVLSCESQQVGAVARIAHLLTLPRELVGKGDLFMLKVSGNSMIDASICDGDWVVVRQQQNAENGDIVAALLEDEATVKTFKQRDGHTWLLPRNSAFEPILGDFGQFQPFLGQFAPLLVMGNLTPYCLGIEPSNCSGDWPWAGHFTVVDRVDGTDFRSCSAAENFFGDVQV